MNQQIPAILAKPGSAGPGHDPDSLDQDDDLRADLAEQHGVDAAAPLPVMGKTDALDKLQESLGEHKGKLAIGAAATLGLMIYYKWREKNLAKEDPQEYARLQRIKSGLHIDELAPLSPAAGED